MLTRVPGQGVSRDTSEISLQEFVAIGHIVQELKPATRTPQRGGAGRRDLGHVIGSAMRPHLAGPQVHDASRRVQIPWVGIPLVYSSRMPSVRFGQAFHPPDCRGRRYFGGHPLLFTSGGLLSADKPG